MAENVTSTGPAGLSSLPPWVQALAFIGLPGFIALYLLGAVPGMASPLVAGIQDHQKAMVEHERGDMVRAQNLLDSLTAICLRLPDKPNAPRCRQ